MTTLIDRTAACFVDGLTTRHVVTDFFPLFITLIVNQISTILVLSMDEYESLPESCGPQIHMLAGAGAGIAEHCVMYPVDVVKTRMQSLNPCPQATYRNVPGALAQIIQKEGLFRPWKGMSVLVLSAGPAHAMYFACYEKMKRSFARSGTGNDNVLAQGKLFFNLYKT